MQGAKPCCTPFGSHKLDHTGSLLPNPTEYRSIVGGLQYLTWTRPDLAFAVNQLCQFMHAPREQHFQAAKRVLRFLKGSVSQGLWFTKGLVDLTAYSDADWAGSTFDRRSTSGYFVFLGPNLISWSAKKQSTVARSSTEAEYRSLAHTAAELTWVCKILRDLHYPLPKLPTLWCDNISAISLASNPVFHARTKHVEIDYHYIRELVLANLLTVQFVCSADQLADLHTKSLSKSQFRYLCSKLPVGISSDPSSRLRGCIKEDSKSSISVTVK
ncbi:nuclear cap-binding protein subunit 1-like [Pyrus ussuriensis x Pyrus communis]|uniref:Nuclear cap-binding protein subunit 1-like n=1 Tax=Pyrus ussuriensis x Pyrus communis TaxID=2448454 RepID=A0A5N5FSZ1_9ROSA|nr:nuclear cap-binding protein subunit 1-like [Pyrus ussuriensis x Pyrus communis]